MLRKCILPLAAIFALSLAVAGHSQTLTFTQAVYVNGSTAAQGTIRDAVTGVSIPNKMSVMLLVAKASNGAAYGRLSLMDARWKVLSSTSCTVNWADITANSATFKFRVAYSTTGDWAIFKFTRTATNVALDLKITNYYGTTVWITYPTMYLSLADVSLTPP
jgi:hypothetical protein